MALRFFLTDTITVERNTPSKDAMGGRTDSFASLSGATDIRAKIYKHDEKLKKIDSMFARPDWKGDFAIVCDTACGARPGDRVKHGSTYYTIHGTFDYGHPRLNSQVIYVMDCLLVRAGSGTT